MNPQPQSKKSPGAPASSAVERLFVGWLLSTLLLVALLAVLTLLGVGQLRRQADALNRQQTQLDDILRRLEAIESTDAAAVNPGTGPETKEITGTGRNSDRPPKPRSATQAAAPPPADADVGASFDALVGTPAARSAAVFLSVSDRARARALLERAESAVLDSVSHSRLQLLAQLVGDEPRAAAHARAAAAAPAGIDEEIETRLSFESGAIADAFAHAILWVDSTDSPPPAALLILAICAAEQGDISAAADAIDAVPPGVRLDASSLAAVGETCVAIEAWKPLEKWIAAAEPGVRTAPVVQRHLATLLLHTRRHTDALAVVTALLEGSPGDPDLLILQAAALVEARQFEAAKATLARITAVPVPGAAAYWRGIIELRSGSADEARKWLSAAVEAGGQTAAALEALAQLDIAAADAAGSGDLATARRALSAAEKKLASAIDANPRRASAYFLLAIVHAKASRTDDTRAALRRAVQLDPPIAEDAKKVPAIARLIPPEEIDRLASVAD